MKVHPRRWYQFKLSTWFVLAAIVCWAATRWPFYDQYAPALAKLNDVLRALQDDLHGDPFRGHDGIRRHLWYWKVKLSLETLAPAIFMLTVFLCAKSASRIGQYYQKRQRAVDGIPAVDLDPGPATSPVRYFGFSTLQLLAITTLCGVAAAAARVPIGMSLRDRAYSGHYYPYEDIAGPLAIVSVTALFAAIGLLTHDLVESTFVGLMIGMAMALIIRP